MRVIVCSALFSLLLSTSIALKVRHRRSINQASLEALQEALDEYDRPMDDDVSYDNEEDDFVPMMQRRDGKTAEKTISYVYDSDINGGKPTVSVLTAVKRTEKKKRSGEAMSSEEMDAILAGAGAEDKAKRDEDDEVMEDDDDDITFRKKKSPEGRKKELLRKYLENALADKRVTIKKKRSPPENLNAVNKEDVASDNDMEKMAEIEERNRRLEFLVRRTALIDLENTYLANALNAATIAQTSRRGDPATKTYLTKELKELLKAEEVEREISEMDGSLPERDAEEKRKKKRSQMESEAEAEPEGAGFGEDEVDANANANAVELDPVSNSEEEKESNVMALANALREQDSDIQMQEPVGEDEDTFPVETGCRPLKNMADGCKFIRKNYLLEMDEEASALCDAHQICYLCAESNGFSAKGCDEAYLRSAASLCNEEPPPTTAQWKRPRCW